MTAPLIIVLERPWDPSAKIALTELLPELHKRGYNQLYIEYSENLDEAACQNALQNKLNYVENIYKPAKEYFQNLKFPKDLLALPVSNLVRLFNRLYPPPPNLLFAKPKQTPEETTARHFRFLLANRWLLYLLEEAKIYKFFYRAIFRPHTQLETLSESFKKDEKIVLLINQNRFSDLRAGLAQYFTPDQYRLVQYGCPEELYYDTCTTDCCWKPVINTEINQRQSIVIDTRRREWIAPFVDEFASVLDDSILAPPTFTPQQAITTCQTSCRPHPPNPAECNAEHPGNDLGSPRTWVCRSAL